MNKNQAMMSAAMLEASWSSRKKDMLDLISPFVMYAVATLTAPGSKIDTRAVLAYVHDNFAYVDMPEIIIKKVLQRKPYSAVERRKKAFYLSKPIDDKIAEMDRRKKECENYLGGLGERLSDYLSMHCKKIKNVNNKQAIAYLHNFFAYHGLFVGTEDLASANISPKDYEIDYYIARYILESKDAGSIEYSYIMDLIKGYFLRLAIYIQPENGNIQSANYSGTTFVYDTPFLLNLLGYCGREKEDSAKGLHVALKNQKGKFAYFPHVGQEIIDILFAYKHSLDPDTDTRGTRTLEGLNDKNYKPSDVEREITILESRLSNQFGIFQQEIPLYEENKDGTVNQEKVLSETEIKQFIRDNTPHYTEDNLKNDVASALAIHRLRGEHDCHEIESCNYIFLTTNCDFIRAFNRYYRENINGKTFQLVISDSDLSALTWIKSGDVGSIPERELLKNAYLAMQPIPEIMTRVDEILQKLKDDGQMSSEQVIALRASRFFQNEIWKASFGDVECITEQSVRDVDRKFKENILKDSNARRDKEIKAQKERARIIADEEAKQERTKWIKPRKMLTLLAMVLIAIVGIIGTIISFSSQKTLLFSIVMILTTLLGIVSTVDTVLTRKGWILQWLEKKANLYETRIREEKLEEYSRMMFGDKDNK